MRARPLSRAPRSNRPGGAATWLAALAACHTAAPTPTQRSTTATTPILTPAPTPVVAALRSIATWTIDSQVLGETRRICVYTPPGYLEHPDARYPVLYMPDGGIDEDFVHVVEAIHFGATWELLQPMLVVGIENTERRRDLVGPTEVKAELRAAPHCGGAAAFRQFFRDELMPLIRVQYRSNGHDAIIGESLAGLFVVETLFEAPDLFDDYIALSPSLWWNHGSVVARARERLALLGSSPARLYLASADEDDIVATVEQLVTLLREQTPTGLTWEYQPMPSQFHDTIYRAAAPRAFRRLFGHE